MKSTALFLVFGRGLKAVAIPLMVLSFLFVGLSFGHDSAAYSATPQERQSISSGVLGGELKLVKEFPSGAWFSRMPNGNADQEPPHVFPIEKILNVDNSSVMVSTGNGLPVIVKQSEIAYSLTETDTGRLVVSLQGRKFMPGAVIDVYETGNRDRPVAHGEIGQTFSLTPGAFDIKVAVGLDKNIYENWTQSIDVNGGRTKSVNIVLPVGTLKINAFVENAGQMDGKECRVHIYALGNTSNDLSVMSCSETFALDPGKYDLRVEFTNSEDKPSVWIRNVKVKKGQHQILNAEFDSMWIITDAYVGWRKIQGDEVLVYYYPAGDSTNFITSKVGGVPSIFQAGTYGIRVEYVGGPYVFSQWIGYETVLPGATEKVSARLNAGSLYCMVESGRVVDLKTGNVLLTTQLNDTLLLPSGSYKLINGQGKEISFTIDNGGKSFV